MFIWERTPRLQLGQPAALISWGDFNFYLHERFRPGLQVWTYHVVLILFQFGFSYSSATITLNSAFILGLSASKSNPMKTICDF